MASLITNSLGNPLFTGGLVYLLTNAPEQYRLPVLDFLQTTLMLSPGAIEGLITGFKALAGLGAISSINKKLNSLAFTHWQWSANKQRWNWPTEIAVVTGGCMGIGEGITDNLLREGLRVVIFDVAPLPAKYQNKDRLLYIKCDVTSPESIKEAATEVRSKWGHPSVIVNNAGIQILGLTVDLSLETVNKIFQVNVISHFYMVQEFLPNMLKEDKGHIVSIASMASFIGMPGIQSYSASKAGALAFQEGLAMELKHVHKKKGIMLTTVHPAWVHTPMVAAYQKDVNLKIEGAVLIKDIGKIVSDQVISCRGAQLLVPDKMALKVGTLLRAMPNWMQEGARDLAVMTQEDNAIKTLATRYEAKSKL